ncbi:MAG: hypothetical protein ACLUZ3_02880 [Blautia wexlerae]
MALRASSLRRGVSAIFSAFSRSVSRDWFICVSVAAVEVLYSEVIVLVFEMAFIVLRRTVGKITRISDDRKICIRKDN